ncbi:BTAD domain-containing putative transcriptional regulator [Actinocrispum sp. NPDC049592]|uniref:BTAD domain-containing putative transcriptional regulator n=1 Tax=Actinocrispum sp. NPDC049592 TaxID=3154835 RepID=UPI003434E17C
MDGTLRVRLLGTVAAWRGDAEVELGASRQRAVFAVLAMNAGQVVSRETVIDAVWGEQAPATAGNTLQTYISRLRRALEPDRTRWKDGQVLVSAGAGYQLRVDSLDVREFDRLRHEADRAWARQDIAAARAFLDEALALQAGEPLGEVDSPFATLHRKRLAELRLAALERRAETMIAVNDPAAVAELQRLTDAYPLRESLVGLLMTALSQAGRDVEAVGLFRETEERLVAELGIEPGAPLRRILDQIVAARPAEHSPLPGAPQVLVGRSSELAVLRSRIADLSRGLGATIWIEGGDGVGKTALLATAFASTEHVYWAAADESDRPLGLMLSALGVSRFELAEGVAGANAEGFAAVDWLAEYVDRLASGGPVVLVLEDLQWADDASALVWHRLAKIARVSALLLVGTCRPVPRRTEVDRMRAAVLSGGELIRLGSLDPKQSAELTAVLLDSAPGPELTVITECAAGNPLFLHEVVDALVHDGLISDGELAESADQITDLCPPALRSVVTKRLGTLSETTREALRWAAVLGSSFDLGDLATVTGRSAYALITVTEEATSAGVLVEAGVRLAFRHPLVRRVLYTSMPLSVRLALHRQAAEMLDAADASVERVAEQLLAAPASADAWMTQWLLANVNSVAGRSPSVATDLLRRSAESRGPVREVLMTRLVRLMFWLGEHPEAEARAVLAMTEDSDLAAEMRLVLAYFETPQVLFDRPPQSQVQLSLLSEEVFKLHSLDLLADADRIVTPAGRQGLHVPAAVHYFWLGRWDEALSEVDAVVQDGPPITFHGLNERRLIHLLHGTAALISAHREEPYRSAGLRGEFLLVADSVVAEQEGRPDEALALLRPLVEQGAYQWLPGVARLALDLGDVATASAASAACEAASSPRAKVSARWCRGLLDRDTTALLDVAKHFDEIGRKIEYAMAAEDAAVLLESPGDAQRAFLNAQAVYTELGATWDLRRAATRLASAKKTA